jgi:hypothetical protein
LDRKEYDLQQVITNTESFTYKIFGQPIVSEIQLDALVKCELDEYDIDPIRVRLGVVNENLESQAVQDSTWYKFNATEFIYHLPGILKFSASNGNQIVLEPLHDDMKHVLLFFYSNAIAAALFQRGITPFHVSGVLDKSGKAWLFAAPSRTGKSTTALKLKERGFELFTDDTALLEVIDGRPMAIASYPMVRIWSETLESQKVFASDRAYQMRPNIDKFGIHFHDEFRQDPVEIGGIVFLNNKTDDLWIEKISTIEAFRLLRQNVYRNSWVTGMGLEKVIYGLVTSVVSKVPYYEAYRPKDTDSFDAFADLIVGKILSL